ncbi:MAG: hypothetical protein ABI663_20515 [Chryseolinea sp.]
MMRIILALLLVVGCVFSSLGQGTLADYQRAEAQGKLYRNKVYNDPHGFYWLGGNEAFWYLNTSKTGSEFILADIAKKTQKPAFDHAKLAKSL